MGNIRLFRKEALRQQFRTQEFGEAVIEQPRALDRAILYLLGCVLLLAGMAAAIPVPSGLDLPLQVAEENFVPVVMGRPAVVEQHLLPDGASVMPHQPVARLRYFAESGEAEILEIARSAEKGVYFAVMGAGAVVEPLQPVARVLREEPDNRYGFWLQDGNRELNLAVGRLVRLSAGRHSVWGKLVAVSGPYENNRKKLVVELPSGSETELLNPHAEVFLHVESRSRNVLALLSKQS